MFSCVCKKPAWLKSPTARLVHQTRPHQLCWSDQKIEKTCQLQVAVLIRSVAERKFREVNSFAPVPWSETLQFRLVQEALSLLNYINFSSVLSFICVFLACHRTSYRTASPCTAKVDDHLAGATTRGKVCGSHRVRAPNIVPYTLFINKSPG